MPLTPRERMQACLAGGGAVGLFHSGPVNVALTLALVGLGTVLVWRTGTAPVREPVQRSAALFLSSWIAAYAAFLFFWMPQNTFYRLFYLPPLVLLCGTALKRCGGRRAMCVVVGLFGAWNVLFYIHPHSLAETNTVLRGALAMQSIWKPGTWVYVGSFNADDWTVFCFNPQVMFKGLDRARLAEAAVELKSMENSGHETWIDHSAIESLRSDHVGERWLTDHTRAGFARDFSDSKHGVRFLRLFP